MKRIALVLALLLPGLPLAASAQDGTVTVTVNGSPVTFDQPPVERVGRVYVPLRGVFERLGATVVYDGGKINATRGTTSISLQIGSNSAVVNGAPTALDAPPFLIGDRALVPLRFVAQALGAGVSYDGSARSVAITQAVAAAPPVVITPVPAPRPPAPILRLVRIEPGDHATVRGPRPQIAATFPRPVNADAVHVRLDGRDVTANAYVSTRAVSYDPQFDLPYGVHEVVVTAPGVAQTWTFANAVQPEPNYLSEVAPANGTIVPNVFVVQGQTRPGSRVRIVATTNAQLGFGENDESIVRAEVVAAPDGRFAHTITVYEASAGVIDVRIESLAPNGADAVRTLRLLPRPR